MSKYTKRFLRMALTLVLILGLIPTLALAAETETESESVAVIGETGYPTLQAAIDGAQDGDTITLLTNVAEVVAFTRPEGMSVTIDGDGHALNGIIYVGEEEGTVSVADLTVQNCAFSNRSLHYALELLPGANAVTVENCSAQGYKYGLIRIASSTAMVTVSDTQVQNVSFGAVVEACAFAAFRDVTVRNTEYGIAAMNISQQEITVDSCTFDNVRQPIYVEEMDEATVTFTFQGVTDLGMYEAVDEETYESFMAPATLPESDYARIVAATQIATKVYGQLQPAIDAAQADATITLMGNVTEVVTFQKPQGMNITIDGAGHGFSGIIYVGNEQGDPVADLTVKNIAFSNRWQHYALELLPGANAVTVENCTAQGYKYGLMMVSAPTAQVTVTDTQVRNVSYGAVIDCCASALFQNMTVSNTAFGIAAMNTCENAVTVDSCTFDNVQQPIYVEEMDEAIVTFTFLGITDLGMYEAVDEETYEVVMMPAALPFSDYARIVAAAQAGTRIYADFLTAAKAVEEGQTLTLLADAAVKDLAVRTGRTLDLNGLTLTADYFAAFKGADIIDSSLENTGLLAVAADCAVLPADNTQLPLWNGAGYIFTQILKCDAQQETAADGTTVYTFQPYFEAPAHPHLTSGNVKIALRLCWDTASGTVWQDYVFPAAAVRAVAGSYDAATGTYGRSFKAVLKNTTGTQVEASLILASGTGVEMRCPIS